MYFKVLQAYSKELRLIELKKVFSSVLLGVYLIGRSPARRLFRQLLYLFFGFQFRLNLLLKSVRQSVKMKYKYLWQLLCVDRDRDWRKEQGSVKEELSHTDFEVRLTWAELTCPSFDSFRLPCFLLLSCHVSELGLNLGSAQFSPSQPESFPFWLF